MVANRSPLVKVPRRKFNKYDKPAPAEIPSLWGELSTLGDLAPDGQRGGIHRLRSRLLDSVPSWRIPEVLDSLAAGGQPA